MIDSGIINLFDLLLTDHTSVVAPEQRFLELSGKTARFLLTDRDYSLERRTPSVEPGCDCLYGACGKLNGSDECLIIRHQMDESFADGV
jgi:hypothetical protein